jgi:YkoY family integral membrane protein
MADPVALDPSSWIHIGGTLAALALLEAVLSADNAVAIAALVRDLEPAQLRTRALNGGLVAAFGLRLLVIILASWVLRYPQMQLLGGCYLLWLAIRHFQDQFASEAEAEAEDARGSLRLFTVIGMVALTDLAFSLDSVTAAMAVTDQVWLVVLGGAMGVAMLRFLAAWVMVWMERFVNLQNAAYLTVLAVGVRLVARVLVPSLAPPESVLLVMMLAFFLWGFSQRRDPVAPVQESSSSAIGVCMTPKCTSANTTAV